MTPPGGVKLDFNPNEVTAVLRPRTACGRLRPHVGAPNRVTLCGGLGVFMEQSAASAGGTGKIDDLGVTSRIKNRSVHPRQKCPDRPVLRLRRRPPTCCRNRPDRKS